MADLLLLLFFIALIDSANPLNIGAHVYLLGTERPISSTLYLLFGILVTYVAIGIILAVGVVAIVTEYLQKPPGIWDYVMGFLIGCLLLWVATYVYQTRTKEPSHKKPKSMHAHHIILLGAGITLLNIPTMVPYLAAINLIVKEGLNLWMNFLLILFYNLIYVLPLLAMFAMYVLLGPAIKGTLEKINAFVDRWNAPVAAAFLALLGLILIADSVGYLFGMPLF